MEVKNLPDQSEEIPEVEEDKNNSSHLAPEKVDKEISEDKEESFQKQSQGAVVSDDQLQSDVPQSAQEQINLEKKSDEEPIHSEEKILEDANQTAQILDIIEEEPKQVTAGAPVAPILPPKENIDDLRTRVQQEIQNDKEVDAQRQQSYGQSNASSSDQTFQYYQNGVQVIPGEPQFDPIDQTTPDQRDDLEVFRLVFEMFDHEKQGYIDKYDLYMICQGYLNNDRQYMTQYRSPEEVMAFLDQFSQGDTSFSQVDSISFGEFVTLIWTMDEQRRNNSLQVHQSVQEQNVETAGDYQDITGILNLRIDQATPDVKREKFNVEAQTAGIGENTPGYSNMEETPGIKKHLKMDNKNRTAQGTAQGAYTNRTQKIHSTLNNSIMSITKHSSIELKSKNASVIHLKEAGLVSTQDELSKEYGEMIPKTGIYSLPDYKVTAFLRILTDYHKKLESDQSYLQAKQARIKFKQLAKIELRRQIRKMQERQAIELQKIENIQRNQFVEFTHAWDVYMQDYEAAAYESLRKMREKHDIEVVNLRQDILSRYHAFTLSKTCCDIRAQERRHFQVKEYIKANQLREQADALEILEIQKHQEAINVKVDKEEEKLRKLQQLQINSLMKRIQRDRDEQLIHRQTDSRILIQRNKNMLADVIERQQIETKNTVTFLKFSLGKRAPKTEAIGIHNSSIMTQSKLGSISNAGISYITENTQFHSPKRVTVRQRATTVFQENKYKRPADYIKQLMKIQTKHHEKSPKKGPHQKVSLPEIIAYNQNFNEKYQNTNLSLEHINIVGIADKRQATMLQKIKNVRVSQKLSKLQQLKPRDSRIYGSREDDDENFHSFSYKNKPTNNARRGNSSMNSYYDVNADKNAQLMLNNLKLQQINMKSQLRKDGSELQQQN